MQIHPRSLSLVAASQCNQKYSKTSRKPICTDMFTTQRSSRVTRILSVNDQAPEKLSVVVSCDSVVHESSGRSQATMRELGLRSVNERGRLSYAMMVNPGRCVVANEQSTLSLPKLKLHLG